MCLRPTLLLARAKQARQLGFCRQNSSTQLRSVAYNYFYRIFANSVPLIRLSSVTAYFPALPRYHKSRFYTYHLSVSYNISDLLTYKWIYLSMGNSETNPNKNLKNRLGARPSNLHFHLTSHAHTRLETV